jgi:probable HAF family extracellular repeat protein
MAGIDWMRALQILAAACLVPSGAMAATNTWKTVDLGAPGMISRANAVSDAGHVVGCTQQADGSFNAFIWFAGQMRDLGKGDASTTGQSCATAVNDSGVAVGHTPTRDLVIWNPDGSVRPLGLRGTANDINSAGDIVGSFQSGGRDRAFLWRNGVVTEIGVVDEANAFAYGSATGINDAGQVSGTLNGSAFYYANGALQAIPGLSLGNDINGRGEIIGMARDGGPGGPWVGIWRNGNVEIFRGVGQTSGVAINTPGRALGDAEGLHGFVIQGEGYMRLQTIPEVVAARWGRMEPADISDRGWIVGHASDSAFLLIPVEAHDVGGDARADIVVQQPGAARLWTMDGLQRTADTSLATAQGESLSQVADFNGDGKQDFLWVNATGAYRVELRDGAQSLGSTAVLGGGTGWQATGHGDFNGDGKQDLLWKHSNGNHGLWLMGGPTFTAAGGLAPPGPGFAIAQSADFDADRKADLLWRHADGRVVVALMDGFTVRAVSNVIAAGATWTPVKAADFNADGRVDLLWKHTSGAYGIWMMNGAGFSQAATVLAAGSGWQFVLSADLSGDGKADLVWEHADGRHGAWLMDGTTLLHAAVILGPRTGWRAVSARDLDGNGTDDLVWRHSGGSHGAWLMSGLAATSTAALGSGGVLVP